MAGQRASGVATAQVQRTLRQTFGFRRLREGQQPVIERVLAGLPTLAILPTGAGKSLCYQLPALLLPGLTVVVSPLIALIKDQCDALAELGIGAVQCHSGQPAADAAAARAAIADHSARIVYTTPEQLADADLVGALAGAGVSLLVVDEAHCISQWGFDFRPAFLDLGPALPRLGAPTVLALTATATESVVDDIARLLGIPKSGVIAAAVYRANLHLHAEHIAREDDKLPRTLAIVRATAGCGMVYAATVKAAEEIHAALEAAGESVGLYHGKLGAARRRASQDAFMSGGVRVMVATNAFGLGIDKADVRFVVHYQIPSGLDAYYQEAGRAGRDGAPAQCTLLYAGADKSVQQFFLAGRYPEPADFEAVYAAIRRNPPPGGWTAEALVEAIDGNRRKTKVALGELILRGLVGRTRAGGLKPSAQAGWDARAMLQIAARYRERREQDRALLEAMVAYAQSGRCRWGSLLDHFGQKLGAPRCGTCDICLRLSAHAAQPALQADAQPAAPSEPIRVAFAPGERVRTRRHGFGVVREADELCVTVEFANGSQRCFQSQFVRPAAQV